MSVQNNPDFKFAMAPSFKLYFQMGKRAVFNKFEKLWNKNKDLIASEDHDGILSASISSVLYSKAVTVFNGVFQGYQESYPISKLAVGTIVFIKGTSLVIQSGFLQKTSSLLKRTFSKSEAKDPASCDYRTALLGICFIGGGIAVIYDGFSQMSSQNEEDNFDLCSFVEDEYEQSACLVYSPEALEVKRSDPRPKVLVFSSNEAGDHNKALDPMRNVLATLKGRSVLGEMNERYDLAYQTIKSSPYEICVSVRNILNSGMEVDSITIMGHGSNSAINLSNHVLCTKENLHPICTHLPNDCFQGWDKKPLIINLFSCSTGVGGEDSFAFHFSRENPGIEVHAARGDFYKASLSPNNSKLNYHGDIVITNFETYHGELQATRSGEAEEYFDTTRTFRSDYDKNGNLLTSICDNEKFSMDKRGELATPPIPNYPRCDKATESENS